MGAKLKCNRAGVAVTVKQRAEKDSVGVAMPVYAEGRVIELGEGRVGIYIARDFRDGLAPLLGKRVRLLVLGVAAPRRRREKRRRS
jgi:hypothetical protein